MGVDMKEASGKTMLLLGVLILLSLSAAGVSTKSILIGLAVVAVLILVLFLWGIYYWIKIINQKGEPTEVDNRLRGL